jgi:hypothetical protein
MKKEIILPEFRLAGRFPIKRNRVPVEASARFPPLEKITKSIYLNVPNYELFISTYIDVLDRELVSLFISTIGRSQFYDEVILCVYMNIESIAKHFEVAYTPGQEQTVYLKIMNVLYDMMKDIIEKVLTVSQGRDGPRRQIYEYYFFSGKDVNKEDAIFGKLSSDVEISKIQLIPNKDWSVVDSNTNKNKIGETKDSVNTLQRNLFILSAREEVPMLDLLGLTIDEFDMFIKILPSDAAFVTIRKAKLEFFGDITSELEKLLDECDKLDSQTKLLISLRVKFNTDVDGMSIAELQKYSELETKNVVPNAKDKLNSSIAVMNNFVEYYNANKVFRFKSKTLDSSLELVKELLSSTFFTFLSNFKTMHKEKLKSSLETTKKATSARPTTQAQTAQKRAAVSDENIISKAFKTEEQLNQDVVMSAPDEGSSSSEV